MTQNELGECRSNWVRTQTRRMNARRDFAEAKRKHRIAQIEEAPPSSSRWRCRRRWTVMRAGSGPSWCGRGTRALRELAGTEPGGDARASLVSLADQSGRALVSHERPAQLDGWLCRQDAIDTGHRVIGAHEVANVGHDRDQLSTMASEAMAAIGVLCSLGWPPAATTWRMSCRQEA